MLDSLIQSWTFSFVLVLCRVGGTIGLLPGLGEMSIPLRLRLSLMIAVSLLLTPSLATYLPAHPDTFIGILRVALTELSIGLFLGLLARLFFSTLWTAGSVIANQTGLINIFSPSPVQHEHGPIFGTYLSLAAIVLIFATNLHHVWLKGLVASYSIFVPGAPLMVGDMTRSVISVVSESFNLCVMLAGPFIVLSVVFSVGLGLLSRLVPEFSIYFVSLPLQILLGLLILILSIGTGLSLFFDQFSQRFFGLNP